MKRSLYLIAGLMIACMSATAQDASSPKFTVKPTGRILMDGAAYIGGNGDYDAETYSADKKFVSGVAIPDFRLGVKASYGKWSAKVDAGFAYAKVNLKDVFIQYTFDEFNLVKAGYFVPQFGLNSETSSSMKTSYEEPTSNEFFNANPRLLGISYVFSKNQYFAAVTAFAEANAMKENATEMDKQAWGAETRLVWRPNHSDGNGLQIGCSFNYSTPTEDNHTAFVYTSNFPSRVSKVNLLTADITHARGMFKMSPEFLLIKDRFAFESQYYFMNVTRKDGLHHYRAHGAYGLFRTLLIGDRYGYNMGDCGMATPAPNSFELVLGYNYTNASCSRAGIYGGISNDINCTLNYYINKYMLARLRYSYTNVRDRRVEGMMPDRHVNTIEARLQVIF
ncbi:MAG: ATPase [Muribaculaceae bacterium]|nr:ATPase [Muribaculaceae bacterium]